ncbi:hypothetical protein QQP08_012141 [Theobroma cacao]|nr:hypothetical protein QQP08_012141 [Theobroma cacao]
MGEIQQKQLHCYWFPYSGLLRYLKLGCQLYAANNFMKETSIGISIDKAAKGLLAELSNMPDSTFSICSNFPALPYPLNTMFWVTVFGVINRSSISPYSDSTKSNREASTQALIKVLYVKTSGWQQGRVFIWLRVAKASSMRLFRQ